MCLGRNEKGGPRRCDSHARVALEKACLAAAAAHTEVSRLEDELTDAHRHYPNDHAFREALKTRMRALSTDTGEPHDKIARRFALQQFLVRLNDAEPQCWVLTGGTALQYRSPEARTTLDADLATAIEGTHIEGRIRAAIARRPGERGDFTVKITERDSDVGGYRCRLVYTLDGKRFANASVDIVTRRELPDQPVLITSPRVVDVDDATPTGPVWTYPAENHVADKVAAMYQKYGDGTEASTRPHDLADLVVLARSSEVDATELRRRLSAEAVRRGCTYPRTVDLPTERWRDTYDGKVDGPALPPEVRDLDSALNSARAFLDPILSGRVTAGRWNPSAGRWEPPPSR